MKKIIAVVLTLLLIAVCFTGCKGADEPKPPPTDSSTPSPNATDGKRDIPLIGMSHLGVGTNNYTTIYTDTLYKMMEEEFKGQVEFYLVDSQGDAEKRFPTLMTLLK